MNIESLRSSRSSYGDPRYLSAYSNGVSSLPSKVLVDGYRGTSDLSNDDRSQYSTVCVCLRVGLGLVTLADSHSSNLYSSARIPSGVRYRSM